MTTTTLHLKVQRSRFLQHTLTALSSVLPGLFQAGDATASMAAETHEQRASREAAEVRDMAAGYAGSQPGFAADLYAAAARHESKRHPV